MSDPQNHKGQVSYQEIREILDKISIFGGLSEDQQKRMTALLKTITYERGDYIFRQEEEASYIYIIRSGKVQIISESPESKCLLAVFVTGDCFGETSILGIQPHSASAIAADKTVLMVLERKVLISIFETDKELFGLLVLNIARETCRRLHHIDEILRAKCGIGSSQRYTTPG